MLVSVIGLGETGSSISLLLLSEFSNIHLNIMDPKPLLSGRIIDLGHAGMVRNNNVSWNNDELISKSDFIFFCAGSRNKPGMDRLTRARENHALIRTIFGEIELKSNCSIIVISNPVDAMAAWIYDYFDQRVQVIGTGTLLDTYRLEVILAKHAQVDLDKVNATVLGEHGEAMFPVWSQTNIHEELITNLYGEDELNTLEKELKRTATLIRKTEDATKYGIASTALEIMRRLQSKVMSNSIASIPFSDGQDQRPVTFVGQQVMIGNGKVEARSRNSLTASEKDLFQTSVRKLSVVLRDY